MAAARVYFDASPLIRQTAIVHSRTSLGPRHRVMSNGYVCAGCRCQLWVRARRLYTQRARSGRAASVTPRANAILPESCKSRSDGTRDASSPLTSYIARYTVVGDTLRSTGEDFLKAGLHIKATRALRSLTPSFSSQRQGYTRHPDCVGRAVQRRRQDSLERQSQQSFLLDVEGKRHISEIADRDISWPKPELGAKDTDLVEDLFVKPDINAPTAPDSWIVGTSVCQCKVSWRGSWEAAAVELEESLKSCRHSQPRRPGASSLPLQKSLPSLISASTRRRTDTNELSSNLVCRVLPPRSRIASPQIAYFHAMRHVASVLESHEDEQRQTPGLDSKNKSVTPQLEEASPKTMSPVQWGGRISTSFAAKMNKRIGRAIETQNPKLMQTLWESSLSTYSTHKNTSQKSLTMPIELYADFLVGFMAIRRPNQAIDVWNDMIQKGVRPNIVTWSAMLKGCGLARDPRSLEDIWSKMLHSGIQPDVQAWATRIYGLGSGGHWQSAMRAFQDMAQAWLNAFKKKFAAKDAPDLATVGDIDGVIKPNTQTVNGLVAILSRGRKDDDLASVLQLARSLGVKADVYTFNPLIRRALNDNKSTMVFALLRQMQSLGLQPDVATFTSLLRSVFNPTDDYEDSDEAVSELSAAQKAGAAAIFAEMERCGVKPNAYTFATLVRGVLERPSSKESHMHGNINAAYAIMWYMQERSIPCSTLIYTSILSAHFFSGTPTDFAAVETLWYRASQDSDVKLDVIFFDRLIEGWARAREIGKMNAALTHASKRGQEPGWRALTDVVQALATVGDWDRIDEIVGHVRLDEEHADQVRHSAGKTDFWDLVESFQR